MLSESGDKSASLWWSGQSWAVKESERLFDWLTRDWRREHRDLVSLVTVHDGHKTCYNELSSMNGGQHQSPANISPSKHDSNIFQVQQFLTPKARGGYNLSVVVKLHLQWILRLSTMLKLQLEVSSCCCHYIIALTTQEMGNWREQGMFRQILSESGAGGNQILNTIAICFLNWHRCWAATVKGYNHLNHYLSSQKHESCSTSQCWRR